MRRIGEKLARGKSLPEIAPGTVFCRIPGKQLLENAGSRVLASDLQFRACGCSRPTWFAPPSRYPAVDAGCLVPAVGGRGAGRGCRRRDLRQRSVPGVTGGVGGRPGHGRYKRRRFRSARRHAASCRSRGRLRSVVACQPSGRTKASGTAHGCGFGGVPGQPAQRQIRGESECQGAGRSRSQVHGRHQAASSGAGTAPHGTAGRECGSSGPVAAGSGHRGSSGCSAAGLCPGSPASHAAACHGEDGTEPAGTKPTGTGGRTALRTHHLRSTFR